MSLKKLQKAVSYHEIISKSLPISQTLDIIDLDSDSFFNPSGYIVDLIFIDGAQINDEYKQQAIKVYNTGYYLYKSSSPWIFFSRIEYGITWGITFIKKLDLGYIEPPFVVASGIIF